VAEYWFDGTDGSDSNDGLSVGAPKLTINSSVTVTGTCTLNIKRGTTVQLVADRYPTGAFTMRPYGDGSANACVLWTGSYQIAHTGTSGTYQFDPGLELSVPSGTINAIYAQQAAMYVDGVTITAAHNGVKIGEGGGYVRNCRISGCRDNGITVGDNAYAAPSSVEITNNVVDVTNAANSGITFHDGTGTGYGGTIANNWIRGGTASDQNNGIGVEAQYIGVKIFGNTIVDASGSGIAISGDSTVAFGNCISGAGSAGFRLGDLTEPANTLMTGNVIYGCGISRDAVGLNASCNLTWQFHNNTVVSVAGVTRVLVTLAVAGATGSMQNNVLVANDANRYIEVFDADASLLYTSNNLYYGSTRATLFAINNGTGKSFAQWQALSALGGGTQDVGGMVSNPLLDADYRLRSVSPCVGAGTYIQGAKHYGGCAVDPVTPDIGAHRYFTARTTTTRSTTTRSTTTRNVALNRTAVPA